VSRTSSSNSTRSAPSETVTRYKEAAVVVDGFHEKTNGIATAPRGVTGSGGVARVVAGWGGEPPHADARDTIATKRRVDAAVRTGFRFLRHGGAPRGAPRETDASDESCYEPDPAPSLRPVIIHLPGISLPAESFATTRCSVSTSVFFAL